MASPRVSVVMPVYNCRDTVERAISSVLDQSLGPDEVELIAVNDGSTDGSGEILDRLAGLHSQVLVIHQRNSGGPGAPRNAGIERAIGEFVFFLDADDYLAPEALERMCAMADENATDIVVGKYVGVGRRVPRWMFRKSVPRTSVLDRDPGVYGTLSPLKLFRRKLLDRAELRFVAGLLSHEDQLFTARAYFAAEGISVLADYDCYCWVEREDGTSVLQQGGAGAADFFPCMDEVMRFTAECVEPGPIRDRLHGRHFRTDVFPRFGPRFLALSESEKRATIKGARGLLNRWYTPGIRELTDVRERVIAHCLRHNLGDALDHFAQEITPTLLVDGGRLLVDHPRFRAPGVPPVEVSDRPPVERAIVRAEWSGGRLVLQGHALIRGLDSDRQSLELVLRGPGEAGEHRLPLSPAPPGATPGDGHDYGSAGFATEIDPATIPLSPGRWEPHVVISAGGFETWTRLGGPAGGVTAPDVRMAPVDGDAQPFIHTAFTGWTEKLTLVAGRRPKDAGPILRIDDVRWTGRGRLRVRGHVPSALPGEPEVEFRPWMRRRGNGAILPGEAKVECHDDRLVLEAEFDLTAFDATRFDASYQLSVGGSLVRERMMLPPGLALPPGARPCAPLALRRGIPYRTGKGELAVRITERKAVRRLRRLLGRIR